MKGVNSDTHCKGGRIYGEIQQRLSTIFLIVDGCYYLCEKKLGGKEYSLDRKPKRKRKKFTNDTNLRTYGKIPPKSEAEAQRKIISERGFISTVLSSTSLCLKKKSRTSVSQEGQTAELLKNFPGSKAVKHERCHQHGRESRASNSTSLEPEELKEMQPGIRTQLLYLLKWAEDHGSSRIFQASGTRIKTTKASCIVD
ncbi:uncharacterized protein LOC143272299 [Peromyscus maniculatus bairdii]|uniref:uncharacterized protein LOC143272299 n=1 Tax=Peromyscus maniculatus bairdii TaxID=230844 RepID=UPI003FD63FAD